MWAKSVLKQQEEAEEAGTSTSRALVVKNSQSSVTRRKRSNSSSSLLSAARKSAARAKVEELLKKEPSQMTMGELALTVPKGRRVNRHEQEVAADNANGSTGSGSSLINSNALNRLRSFSVSSESAALGGSIVTPQVQIIDGKMVILESTVKLSDVATHRSDDLSDQEESVPRRSGARYYMQPQITGRRWGKDETKQFYYVRPVGGGWCWLPVAPVVNADVLVSFVTVLEPGRPELLDDGDALPESEAQGAQVQVQVRGEAPPVADRDRAEGFRRPIRCDDVLHWLRILKLQWTDAKAACMDLQIVRWLV